MRLSEAIMLGTVTVKMEPKNINSCAIGCALNAMGVPEVDFPRQCVGHAERNYAAIKLWPWIGKSYMGESLLNNWGTRIWMMFDFEVCTGDATLEQLVDMVRQCEPDCDCNRFNCDCKAKQDTVVEVEHAHQT